MSAVPLPRHRPAPVRGARPTSAQRARRHLRVVPEHRARHTLLYTLLYLVVGAVMVFGTVTVNALAAADAVEAERLERAVAVEQQRYVTSVAEVARLEDPARIEAAAAELGMVRAESPRQLVLQRTLPADRLDTETVVAGATTDPLKPVLSAER